MEKITLISTTFFTFWVLKIIIVSYLDHRNVVALQNHRDEVPSDFKDSITLEEHQKAADYSMEKLKFNKFNRLMDNIALAILLPLGGANFLLVVTNSFHLSPIYAGLLFFAFLGLFQLILSTPVNYYYHFVIEQKFGFNKMTHKIFILDLFKQILLSIILGGALLSMILYIMQTTKNWWWIAWLATFSFQLLALILYPKFIAPLFNKFTPLTDEKYLESINELTRDTNFPAKELFVMDASIRSAHGNAYFTGFGKNKRIVFFDTLLKTLDPTEVKAVLAHEIGHFHHKHILKSLVKMFFLSGLFFYLINYLSMKPYFFLGHFINNISNHSVLFLFMTILPIYTFLITPINNYFSRKNEFQADDFAKKHAKAEDLITALIKLYKENASSLVIDKLYSSYYYSHPPATERIKGLRGD